MYNRDNDEYIISAIIYKYFMILNEFLENNIPAYKLQDVLYNNDNFVIEIVDSANIPENNSVNDITLSRDVVMTSLADNNMVMSEFDKLLQKYGWYISKIVGNTIHVLKYFGYDNGYYDHEIAVFHNLYLHVTKIKPSIILNTGLKTKDSTDNQIDIDGTMNRGIIYPNPRIYLWKLEAVSNVLKIDGPAKIEKRIACGIKSLLNGLHAGGYGNYVYLIKLPESIRTHFDQEYGPDMPARYINQNIPPSYISYIGTVERLKNSVESGNYKQLKQILKI